MENCSQQFYIVEGITCIVVRKYHHLIFFKHAYDAEKQGKGIYN